jgi:hypothetical protein
LRFYEGVGVLKIESEVLCTNSTALALGHRYETTKLKVATTLCMVTAMNNQSEAVAGWWSVGCVCGGGGQRNCSRATLCSTNLSGSHAALRRDAMVKNLARSRDGSDRRLLFSDWYSEFKTVDGTARVKLSRKLTGMVTQFVPRSKHSLFLL